MGLLDAIKIGAGLLGVGDAAGSNRQAASDMATARSAIDKRNIDKYNDLVYRYDPVQEANQNIEDYRKTIFEPAKKKATQNFMTQFSRGGGDFTGDTAAVVGLANRYDPINNEFARFGLDARANATAKKAQLLQGLMQSGVSVSQAFNNLSQSEKVNPAGSLGMLASGLDSVFGQKKKPTGVAGVPGASDTSSGSGTTVSQRGV